MANKMTNVKALAYALENCELPEDVKAKFEAMKASYEKRGATKRVGPTKAQIARAELAEKVFALMEQGVEYGNAEIASLVPELAGATPQKVSPMMKLLGDRVVIEKVKGKAIYKVA